jgi:3-deoxy-7-phosphoheptulonate synthase
MIVILRDGADVEAVRAAMAERGLWVRPFVDVEHRDRLRFLVEEGSAVVPPAELLRVDGVASVAALDSPHPRLDAQPRVIDVSGTPIGAGRDTAPVVMAGPCSVESPEQIRAIAARLAPLGVRFLRGGAYKPRKSPYSFQGHGAPALRWLREAADEQGMLVVTEALGVQEVGPVAEAADMIQIGSRNMQHTPLLRAVGSAGKPVLLKRGMAATTDDWRMAAEYCLLHGASGVVFCERGIRGFDRSTRNLLDLGAVVLLAHVHGLPVIVDPSHAAGRRDLLRPLGRAALAAGAAGLMLETHDDPGRALSDGPQALHAGEIEAILEEVGASASPASVSRV